MTIEQLLATDARDGRYMDMIRAAFDQTQPRQICAAVAYATNSGVAALDAALSDLQGWQEAEKRWLVGIDYCRSDPPALAHLDKLPYSNVRIFDGEFVSKRKGCVPRNSYHPKAYLLIGSNQSIAVVGSGNLSRTGLLQGIEAGVSISETKPVAIQDIQHWFKNNWQTATSFKKIEEKYGKQHGSLENRRHPMAFEDDAVPESASRAHQLSPSELRKLRVCRHLWIEAGNITRNRGPNLPGNQLMMKRNSRVFFGFEASDLEQDTLVGYATIQFGDNAQKPCSLRFSNNSMDVLTLPVPGSEGPVEYDNQTLHFEQTGVRTFGLSIGSRADARRWQSRSETIDGKLKMKGGRRWGVY